MKISHQSRVNAAMTLNRMQEKLINSSVRSEVWSRAYAGLYYQLTIGQPNKYKLADAVEHFGSIPADEFKSAGEFASVMCSVCDIAHDLGIPPCRRLIGIDWEQKETEPGTGAIHQIFERMTAEFESIRRAA